MAAYNVQVYGVGAKVGVDAVARLQDRTPTSAGIGVLSGSYITMSADSSSVRNLPH